MPALRRFPRMTDTGTSSYVGMMIGRGTPGFMYTPVAAFLTAKRNPAARKTRSRSRQGSGTILGMLRRRRLRNVARRRRSPAPSIGPRGGCPPLSSSRVASVPMSRAVARNSRTASETARRASSRATRTGHVERQGTSDKLVAFLPDVDGVVDAKAVFHGQGLPMRVTRNMIAPTPSPPCLHDAGRIRRTAEDSRRQAQERKWSGTHAVPRQRSHSTRVTVCARFLESLLI